MNHAKCRKRIQEFVYPILLKYLLHDVSWYLMWQTGCKQIYLRKNLYLLNPLKNMMTQHPLWRDQTVLKFKFWVTPIFTRCVKATILLQIWRYIPLTSLYLWMSLLLPLLSLNLECWYGISFPDQIEIT